ncbi:MAG: sigma-70 family RNA polymerase sigma factor [Planctomycetota bacterium]
MTRPDIDRLLEHTDWLRTLCRRLTGEQSGAEDLVQSTLVACIRNPSDPRAARSWLGRVARNLFLDQERSKRRRMRRELIAATERAVPSAEEMAERFEAQRSVSEALLGLDEKYASVLFLHYFDGLDLREIAERTQTNLETVRSRHKRGLALLRERLDRRYGERPAWALLLLTPADVRRVLAAREGPLAPPALAVPALFAAAAAAVLAVAWIGLRPLDSSANQPAGGDATVATLVEPAPPSGLPAAPVPARDDASLLARPTPAGMVVRGRIVALETGDPVGEAAIAFAAGGIVRSAAADPSGTFAVATGLVVPSAAEADAELTVRVTGRVGERVAVRLQPGLRVDGETLDLGDVRLARGTQLDVMVVDADGRPAAGASVAYAASTGAWQLLGTTDAHGQLAVADRLACSDGVDRLVAWGPDGCGWAWAPLTRQASEGRLRIDLRPAAQLAVVVTRDGRPLPGARVSWRPLDAAHDGTWSERLLGPDSDFAAAVATTTDPRGEVSFRGLPADDGYPDGWPLVVTVDPADGDGLRTTREVPIVPNGRGHLHVEVVPLPARELVRVAVVGRGAPLAAIDGRVTVGGRPFAQATADGDGRLTLQLPAPRVRATAVRIAADGFLPALVELDDGPLPEVVELSASWVVSGAVTRSGQPVRDAEVRSERGQQRATTDAFGRFRIAMRVDADELMVQSRTRAGSLQTARQAVPPGATSVAVELPAAKGARFVARLFDRQLRPVDPRVVTLTALGGGGGSAAVELGIGRVTAVDLPPGRWSLFATSAQLHTYGKVFEVSAGDDAIELNLRPGPIASVRGELDLSALPAESRARSITLMHSFADGAARWVDPATGGALPATMRVLGTSNALRLAAGETRFRIDGLDAPRGSIDVFVVHSGPLMGGVSVPLLADQRPVVRLPVRMGTEVRFDWRGDAPRHDVQVLQRDREDGAWSGWVVLRHVPAGQEVRIPPLTLPRGTFEWGLTRAEQGAIPPRTSEVWLAARGPLALIATGAFEVAGQSQLRVPLGEGETAGEGAPRGPR